MLRCHVILRKCEFQTRITNYLDDSVLWEGYCDREPHNEITLDVLNAEVAYVYAKDDQITIVVFPDWLPDDQKLPFFEEVTE